MQHPPPQKVFSSPIHQDYDTSGLDQTCVPEHIWFGAGASDIVRRRLGGVHGQAPTPA